MTMKIHCDGCGQTETVLPDKDTTILQCKFESTFASNGCSTVEWEADLCRSCRKQISDPKQWPRAQESTAA